MTRQFQYCQSPILRWGRMLFLAVGVSALGFVGYAFAKANLFQAYQSWRFDRALRDASATSISHVPLHIPANLAHHATMAPGTSLGRIQISRVGVSVIIVEGTDEKALQRAVGHISGTALPGEPGNVGLAGHRDTFFRALRNIRLNDEVTLTTLAGSYYYRVDSMEVVTPAERDVLTDTAAPVLTLVTCYPFYFIGPAPNRFIVRAHLVSAKISPA
jgi:sortase A